MDLGLNFEDEDLQCSERNQVGDRDLPYNVKMCSDQWFKSALEDMDREGSLEEADVTEELQKTLKFSADFHYYEKDYSSALNKYKRILGTHSSKNSSALCHDVKESLSRCYMYTGQTEQGLQLARQMVNEASMEDEARQRQALALLSFASEKAQNWAECVDALEKLCERQPQFPQSWYKLGDIYRHLYEEDTIVSTNDDNTLVIKQLSSYLRAKHLLLSVMGTASDFICDRNAAMIKQLTLKIDQLPISNSRKEFASEFIKKDVEKQATSSKDGANENRFKEYTF